MKVWLPYVFSGSGTDHFSRRLAASLRDIDVDAFTTAFAHSNQYAPWLLSRHAPPRGTDIILANSWNAFAFCGHGLPVVSVSHHSVFDPALQEFKSRAQRVFHNLLLRRFEDWGFRRAAAVATVSRYSATALERIFPHVRARTILNGIDTDFFTPPEESRGHDGALRLLFVGNLSPRKGIDLLPRIMRSLGKDYLLSYTTGVRRSRNLPETINVRPIGSLDQSTLLKTYRQADVLLFPSRLEGYGYAVAEAMACGLPVVTTDASSMPELINHNQTGLLCPTEDVACFIEQIRRLRANPAERERLGTAARGYAVKHFSAERMATAYRDLFEELLGARA